MEFVFEGRSAPKLPTVRVRFAAPGIDTQQRLTDFRQTGVLPAQQIYAQATYLKYNSLVSGFASTICDWDGLVGRRKLPDSHRGHPESFALLEAFIEDTPEVAGALLLRSAWNNDFMIDFVVSNSELIGLRYPKQKIAPGLMLLTSVYHLGTQLDVDLVCAETASHSTNYWALTLGLGWPLLRFDRPAAALQKALAILGEPGYRLRQQK